MYIQSLTTEDDLWFIDTYPKEINSIPVNEQLLKDSGLKGVFRRKFRLLLDARMDIRRLRVENPDFYFYPFFSAMLTENKEVQRNFLTTLKMAINELRAKKIPIPKWSVIMLNPSWGIHSTNQLHLLDQLNDNENFMICQTKKIIDHPGKKKTENWQWEAGGTRTTGFLILLVSGSTTWPIMRVQRTSKRLNSN
jgi:hypothetical protein